MYYGKKSPNIQIEYFLGVKLRKVKQEKNLRLFACLVVMIIDLAKWPRFYDGAIIGFIVYLAIRETVSIERKVAVGFSRKFL